MSNGQQPSNERAIFEKWLLERQGLESRWNDDRRCYEDFPAHLAWCAWRDSQSAHEQEVRPTAWMRGFTSYRPDEPDEYDVECYYGDEPPADGLQWTPLYSRPAQPPPAECAGCEEFVRMQHDIASLLGVDSDTDSIGLHGRIYGALSAKSAQPPAEKTQWLVAPGDPTCVFTGDLATPIKCMSKERAALVVAAVNAYRAGQPSAREPPAGLRDVVAKIIETARAVDGHANHVIVSRELMGKLVYAWELPCSPQPPCPAPAFLIFYEDHVVTPEVFIGEGAENAARTRFKQARDHWSCHLFVQIDDGARAAQPPVPDLIRRIDEWFAAYMHDRHDHDEAASILARVREFRATSTAPAPRRKTFEFDDRSLESIEQLTASGHTFTGVILRDPATGQERTVNVPCPEASIVKAFSQSPRRVLRENETLEVDEHEHEPVPETPVDQPKARLACTCDIDPDMCFIHN